ncbi:hypothetical protein VPH35_021749 [Triticum aestivum]
MIQCCWATFPPPTSAVPPSRPCSVSSSLWEARVRQLQAVNVGCAKPPPHQVESLIPSSDDFIFASSARRQRNGEWRQGQPPVR